MARRKVITLRVVLYDSTVHTMQVKIFTAVLDGGINIETIALTGTPSVVNVADVPPYCNILVIAMRPFFHGVCLL